MRWVRTSLPLDEIIVGSTELADKNAFEEFVNAGGIEKVRGPLK
ncbi:MAG: hypothetical protein ACREVE_07150 [Gammaproteobacteria bacterium]